MYRDDLPARQLSGWIFAALTPVSIQLGGAVSWVWLAVAALGCGAAVWLVWRYGRYRSKWLCLLRVLVTVAVLGMLMSKAAQCWPGDNYPAVPLIILALAAWSAGKGPSAAARVGCVLFWFVLLTYLAVFGAGARAVRVSWMLPETGLEMDLGVVVLLLVPAAAAVLLRQGEGWHPRMMLPGIFVTVAAVICSGVLSPVLVKRAKDAFYEMGRSLDLLGVARRFEAVISAGMTVGWFALMSLFLTVCGKWVEKLHAGWGRWGVYVVAAAAAVWMLCDLHIPMMICVVAVSIFWVVTPLLEQGIDVQKKS